MSDDSGRILSEITETVGDVAEAAAGELKKFGQSATSQISGHAGQAGGQPSKADIAKAKNATGGGSPQDRSAIEEVKGFGKSVLDQITGHTDQTQGDIAKMAKADNKFSQVESEKIKAKINQIYQEYAAKRAKEQQQQETLAKQQEEQTKQIVEQKKKEEMVAANPAIAKTRVEIKNYGAE